MMHFWTHEEKVSSRRICGPGALEEKGKTWFEKSLFNTKQLENDQTAAGSTSEVCFRVQKKKMSDLL